MHKVNKLPGKRELTIKAFPLVQYITSIVIVVIGIAATFINPASCREHTLLNTPPILIVPERNWRISETETIGQIISRIRADDSENDELIFGLESQSQQTRLPFRIDPFGGVVYLNESLIGRGGQNFFLYVTVSDGQLTAKNEVYVNILGKNAKGRESRPPLVSSVVFNMSHFLPDFNRLPGVQSSQIQSPNRKASQFLPPEFSQGFSSATIITPDQPANNIPTVNKNQFNQYINLIDQNNIRNSTSSSNDSIRTKLTPIKEDGSPTVPTLAIAPSSGEGSATDSAMISFGFNSHIISIALIGCGLFIFAIIVIGFLYYKRLCSFTKTLKKRSKEEMLKKSNQSSMSCANLADDSRTSMVLQHWNGPTAYGNRYVPWDRDQPPQQQLQNEISLPATATAVHSLSADTSEAANSSALTAGVVGGPPSGSVRNTQEMFDKWEFPRHRLKFFNILGEGAFGQVWRCEATDIDGEGGVITVAVKTVKENATEAEKKDLMSELEVMKSLEPHVNVVRFLGCCTDKNPTFVIIEYVKFGKLQSYLRNSREERYYGNTHGKSNMLTSGELTLFMYQVARGMDYLTSRGIIHRDLAARNVLITEDQTCKVADFGFARDVATSKIYERKSEGKLPIRWMAVESLYDNIFSAKSDIWSFGVLMWEIVTLGSTPYPGISASDVMRQVRNGYRLEKPEHCRRELYNIMYYCWSSDPNARPSFGELVHMLDKLLHTEMDYIELEKFPDHNYYNIINMSDEKV